MKLLMAVLVILFVAASVLADYLWKRWVAKQRAARDQRS